MNGETTHRLTGVSPDTYKTPDKSVQLYSQSDQMYVSLFKTSWKELNVSASDRNKEKMKKVVVLSSEKF